jgi:1-phosphatidylinositol phosphodiesterase
MSSLPLADWMAALDGQRSVAELTIPGTHDSGARRGGLRPETQTLDIVGQLDAGIRFFDIRLDDRAGVFRLFHGDVDQRTEFEAGVVLPMRAFLDQHPGEAVIVSVKQEDAGDPARFARDFEQVVARHAASFHVDPDFRRLADGRGKIVLFRRFAGSEIGIPAPPARWQNNATFEIPTAAGPLRIEDHWDLAGALPWQMDGKWGAVAGNLDAAAAGAVTDWYLTFTSGTSDFSFPRAIAGGVPFVAGINERLLDYVTGPGGPRRLGTIVMDFPELPDRRLLQSLVDGNRPAGPAG